MVGLIAVFARGQSDLAKAALNVSHTVKPSWATWHSRLTDRQTDRQTPHTSVTIVCISCLRCSLIIVKMKKVITPKNIVRPWSDHGAAVVEPWYFGMLKVSYSQYLALMKCAYHSNLICATVYEGVCWLNCRRQSMSIWKLSVDFHLIMLPRVSTTCWVCLLSSSHNCSATVMYNGQDCLIIIVVLLPSVPVGSVIENHLLLGGQRQIWFIPFMDNASVCR